jgi:hypothetical protein
MTKAEREQELITELNRKIHALGPEQRGAFEKRCKEIEKGYKYLRTANETRLSAFMFVLGAAIGYFTSHSGAWALGAGFALAAFPLLDGVLDRLERMEYRLMNLEDALEEQIMRSLEKKIRGEHTQ